jgi:hypothetical protein
VRQPIAIAAGRHVLWIADYDGSTITTARLIVRFANRGMEFARR